eukprot:25745-Rhodomonas_salina.4
MVLKDSDSAFLILSVSIVVSLRQEDAAVQKKRMRAQKRWDKVRRAKFMLRLLKGLEHENAQQAAANVEHDASASGEDEEPEDASVSGPTELDKILFKKKTMTSPPPPTKPP